MERIGGEVERELRRFGAQGAMPAIVGAWPAAVGETVSRNAWPARLTRDRTLHVNTSSSAWAFELTQLAPVVLEQLAAALGADVPRGLRFAPGRLPEPAAEGPARAAARPAEPLPEVVREAEEIASGIGGEELRRKVARAAALSLARARSGRSF